MFIKIITIIFLIGSFTQATVFATTNNSMIEKLQERLKVLEPESPIDLKDPPFIEETLPDKIYTFDEVKSKGVEISINYFYSDPNYKRPSYKSYWHSTHWRWSCVPIRVHYALHRIFTTYETASAYYDFTSNVGIADKDFKTTNSLDKILTVVMQTDVEKICTYGNQVLIIGRPKLTGLSIFEIPDDLIKPDNPDQGILFQLSTPDGDEIDYSLIGLFQTQ